MINEEPRKAARTHYAGYEFRSMLEARWAVFFDKMGLHEWEHEPENYDADGKGMLYCPDFRCHTPGGREYFYEVKHKTVATDPKVDAMLATGSNITLLNGDPMAVFVGEAAMCPRCGGIVRGGLHAPADNDEVWLACKQCDMETQEGTDQQVRKGRLGDYSTHKGYVVCAMDTYRSICDRIDKAGDIARKAKFDHSYTPDREALD